MMEATPTTPLPRRPRSRMAVAALVTSVVAPMAWIVIVVMGGGRGRTVWESIRWLYLILGADLLLGLIALVRVAKDRKRVAGLKLAVSGVVISVFGLTLVAPAVRGFLDLFRQMVCFNNIEALSLALQMCASDHYGRLPPAGRWSDSLVPKYVQYPEIFVCPEAPRLRCGYAFNRGLSGASVEKMRGSPQADKTVLLYESDVGWNGAGGPDSLVKEPRHRGKDLYAFADGHIRALPRSRAASLIWNPSP